MNSMRLSACCSAASTSSSCLTLSSSLQYPFARLHMNADQTHNCAMSFCEVTLPKALL